MPYTSPLLGSINLTPAGKTGEQFQSEISAYVAFGNNLFLISSGGGSTLQITNASNPATPVLLERLSFEGYISTSVAAFRDLVAVALVPADYDTTPTRGVVRFYRMASTGALTAVSDVQVGYLPDSVSFNRDGSQLVIANEGQPNTTYTNDPAGSIGIIDISTPTTSPSFTYTELGFEGLTLPTGLRISGPTGTSPSQDIEPEYISIRGDKAYITLQENNGVAVVNLITKRIEAIHALGSVDYSRQAVDLSDQDGLNKASIFLPKLGQIFNGLRMPDGISTFETKGRTYYITANEGDAREYGSYVDIGRNTSAPNSRLNTIREQAPGETLTPTSLGSRSLSIFDAQTGALVWDSGTSLQTISVAAGVYSDSRSDDKGVEVESVITTKIGAQTYAFASLERSSKTTIVAFDITAPSESRYISHVVIDGSVSPEGLLVIPAHESPTQRPLLSVSNEVSNSIDFIDLQNLIKSPGPGSAGFFQQTMLKDVSTATRLDVTSLITNGEFTNGLKPGDSVYSPTGIFDGLGAYNNYDGTFTLLANSELGSTSGTPYLVGNAALTGARISKLIIKKDTDNDASNGYQSAVIAGGIAYTKIIDANGELVVNASQVKGGFSRFCSGSFEKANRFSGGRGFRDSIYLTGEETSEGLLYALDTKSETLYALAGLGRGGWETAIQVDTGNRNTVGVLLLDDNTAPIYLWVGQKASANAPGFLERNGLAKEQGSIYTWVPNTGSIGKDAGVVGVPDSADLNGLALNTAASGQWVLVGSGAEAAVWTEATLRGKANALGALQLSRLEDASINPRNGQQVVLATTGNTAFGGADSLGNLISLDLSGAFNRQGLISNTNRTDLKVIYDGDRQVATWDAVNGNNNGIIDTAEQAAFGATIIRNPDNLTWADDGSIYVQEDRSIAAGYFSQQEASIWKINPNATDPLTGQANAERWLQIDRSAVPTSYGQTDASPTDYGNWESSGIIDVSSIYGEVGGSVFLADVQAHSVFNGNLGGDGYLSQGGQLNLIQNPDLI